MRKSAKLALVSGIVWPNEFCFLVLLPKYKRLSFRWNRLPKSSRKANAPPLLRPSKWRLIGPGVCAEYTAKREPGAHSLRSPPQIQVRFGS